MASEDATSRSLGDLLGRPDVRPPSTPWRHPSGRPAISASPVLEVTATQLITDRRCDKSDHQFAKTIYQMVAAARHSITIESPYPAISRPMATVMKDAARRGVCVTLVTNSYNTIDQKDTYAALMKRRRKLENSGIKIVEIDGCQVLHAKTMTIDGETAFIGSYNFDARSERFNLEIGVVVHDAEFTAALNERIEARMKLANGQQRSLQDNVKLLGRRLRIQICHQCL